MATIVAVRGFPRPDQAGRVLPLIGVADPASARAGSLVEFVLRDDSGVPLSVVQANALDLHLGERVLLQPGDRIRLARGPD